MPSKNAAIGENPQKVLLVRFFIAALVQICLVSNVFSSFDKRAGRLGFFKAAGDSSALDLTLPFKRCWEYKTEEIISGDIASDNDLNIVIPFQTGKLEFLDSNGGGRFWSSRLGGEIVSNLAVGGDKVYVVLRSVENFSLKSISKITGITVWQTKFEMPETFKSVDDKSSLHLYEDKLVLVNQNGEFYAFAKESGEILWHKRIGRNLTSPPVFLQDSIIAETSDKKLSVISAADGAKLRDAAAPDQITVLTAQSEDKIFIGDRQGGVSAVNTVSGGTIWKNRVGGAQISDVTLTPGGLLVSSFDNFVYFLSANSGRRIWKRRLNGKISFKPTVFGKHAIVVTLFDSNASVIELSRGNIVNRIGLEEENFFSGSVLLYKNSLVAATPQGLTGFTNASGECLRR
jgi:outer membrane protein assembly factor BamB